uniref:Large ribosomal subunit protein uL23c n=1 Tax=Dichotomaria marginata TaxID=268567 RepID=A0A1G4NSJ5_9FLOR|nr:Ribosomal protein L23 [Dichotomaria marginata]SCW21594.1 Ribosomal protein L23 [Dichotomaria marginata]
MSKNRIKFLSDIIDRPILTDKSTQLLEENQYSFKVKKYAQKQDVKKAIEYLFNVKVINVNIMNLPVKKRSVGKFTGKKAMYKKAIITIQDGNNINLFPES